LGLSATPSIAQNSQVGININLASIPFFPEASEFAQQGLCPGGLHRNKEFYSPYVEIAGEVPEHIQDVLFDPQTSGGLLICLFDPQTSGGLLICLAPRKTELLLKRLHQAGVADAAIIGEAVKEPRGVVTVK